MRAILTVGVFKAKALYFQGMRDARNDSARTAPTDWVFGYGSLIYKVDFPYLRRHIASIPGWARRFWQGSHDHRGTPEAPGRVLTLVPSPTTICRGVAFEVEHSVYEHLDHREKNGYERHRVTITLTDIEQTVDGTIYLAGKDNPAFLGPDDPDAMAAHIARSRGPSGSNRDYLLNLDEALFRIGESDDHVADLARRVRALTGSER
jgi:cation transport regulator ChaC